jgi:hypothetical protein
MVFGPWTFQKNSASDVLFPMTAVVRDVPLVSVVIVWATTTLRMKIKPRKAVTLVAIMGKGRGHCPSL